MAAVEPQLHLGGEVHQGSNAQALHPGGPGGAGHGSLAGGGVKAQMAQGGNGGAGVLDLMRTGQVGQRQVQQAGFVLEHQAAILLGDVPVLTIGEQRRAHAGGLALDHGQPFVGLRANDHRDAAFDDSRLFKGDLGQGFAQILLMVDRDGGDDRQARGHHVGGIQTPAQTNLQQGPVRRGAGKGEEGGGGGDFKEGDRVGTVLGDTFIQQGGQGGFADQLPRQPDAFVKPGEVGRGIGVDPGARRLQPRAQHGLGRAFAIGAGDVDHRGQMLFGVAQGGQQAVHAVQRQVDDLGVQGHHPFQNGVRAVGGHFSGAVWGASGNATGEGRSPLIAGVWWVNIRRIVTSSSRKSLRWVTRSSIP